MSGARNSVYFLCPLPNTFHGRTQALKVYFRWKIIIIIISPCAVRRAPCVGETQEYIPEKMGQNQNGFQSFFFLLLFSNTFSCLPFLLHRHRCLSIRAESIISEIALKRLLDFRALWIAASSVKPPIAHINLSPDLPIFQSSDRCQSLQIGGPLGNTHTHAATALLCECDLWLWFVSYSSLSTFSHLIRFSSVFGEFEYTFIFLSSMHRTH